MKIKDIIQEKKHEETQVHLLILSSSSTRKEKRREVRYKKRSFSSLFSSPLFVVEKIFFFEYKKPFDIILQFTVFLFLLPK